MQRGALLALLVAHYAPTTSSDAASRQEEEVLQRMLMLQRLYALAAGRVKEDNPDSLVCQAGGLAERGRDSAESGTGRTRLPWVHSLLVSARTATRLSDTRRCLPSLLLLPPSAAQRCPARAATEGSGRAGATW